jgi:hypothetical protein
LTYTNLELARPEPWRLEMPIPDTSKITIEVAMKGQIAAGGSNTVNTVNVFHFRRTTTTNPFVKADIDTAFQGTIVQLFGLAANNRWLQSANSVRAVDDADDLPTDFAHNVAGAVAGDSMTTIEAAYIRLRSGLRGKHYRGSKHFGPLSESDTTAGSEDIFNAGAITNWQNLADGILAGFTDSDGNIWVPVVLSRSLSQLIVNPTTVIAVDVTQATLNKRIGRLRRREAKSVY